MRSEKESSGTSAAFHDTAVHLLHAGKKWLLV
jgi:hypothetical protein